MPLSGLGIVHCIEGSLKNKVYGDHLNIRRLGFFITCLIKLHLYVVISLGHHTQMLFAHVFRDSYSLPIRSTTASPLKLEAYY